MKEYQVKSGEIKERKDLINCICDHAEIRRPTGYDYINIETEFWANDENASDVIVRLDWEDNIIQILKFRIYPDAVKTIQLWNNEVEYNGFYTEPYDEEDEELEIYWHKIRKIIFLN